jgi:hypothetical protein
VVAPPWNPGKTRPSVLDAERLLRRHREGIQRCLAEYLDGEGNRGTEGAERLLDDTRGSLGWAGNQGRDARVERATSCCRGGSFPRIGTRNPWVLRETTGYRLRLVCLLPRLHSCYHRLPR